MKNLMQKISAGAGLLALSALSHAQTAPAEPDYSAITGAVSAGQITVGVMAIAAVLAVVYFTIKGAKTILSMIRGS